MIHNSKIDQNKKNIESFRVISDFLICYRSLDADHFNSKIKRRKAPKLPEKTKIIQENGYFCQYKVNFCQFFIENKHFLSRIFHFLQYNRQNKKF